MSDEPFDSEAQMVKAWQHLEDGDVEAALKIGQRLERLRWTGGFEMQAIALERLERRREAIKVLERGVELCGGPWVLWNLLGNFLSDEGDFQKALEAYQQGLRLEDTKEQVLRLNKGIVLSRLKRHEEALSEMKKLEPAADLEEGGGTFFWHIKAAIAGELDALERESDLAVLCENCREQLEADNNHSEAKARLAAFYANSLARQGELRAADNWINRALLLDRSNNVVQKLLRERLARKLPAGGVYYSILVEGVWPASLSSDGEIYGYFTTYFVVADTPPQAFYFIKEYEPGEALDALELSEFEVLEDQTNDAKGIYETTAYNYFDLEADDDKS